MNKIILFLLCLMFIQFTFCSCSENIEYDTDIKAIPTDSLTFSSLGNSENGNISVKYKYDADTDLITALIENTSDEKYIYSQKVVLKVYDSKKDEYISFEDRLYDDVAMILLPNSKSEMDINIGEKYPEITELYKSDIYLLGISFEDKEGKTETVFANVTIN